VEELFTKKEAADYLKVSERTIDRLRIKLNLPVKRIGRQIRIPKSSVELLLKQDTMSAKERQKTINDLYGE
jgi:excisionase family DNA binding protein|tara:strand:+ start:205 stop:417 length:213 start_codon:yes stop_codon:yes gene_type:complete